MREEGLRVLISRRGDVSLCCFLTAGKFRQAEALWTDIMLFFLVYLVAVGLAAQIV